MEDALLGDSLVARVDTRKNHWVWQGVVADSAVAVEERHNGPSGVDFGVERAGMCTNPKSYSVCSHSGRNKTVDGASCSGRQVALRILP